jgi:uncharacterized protein involved in outer membrane biogenesis
VSNTLTQTDIAREPLESAPVAQKSWLRWPKRIILFFVCLWLASLAISFLIQHTALNRRITARLESAFGRSVEVGSYRFSLWGRPTLEAQSVVVGEDSRFGHEYFLRADSLTMSLRWQSLLLGHLDFGTISLSHPSLNLVRNAEGDWNLAEWLPRLSATPAVVSQGPSNPASRNSSGASTALRFNRINVDSGRINFKRGDEKLPFALIGVTGYLEPAGPGQWSMDLEALPSRSAVIIQQAGTLHLSGRVGGTSSRLRPAALDLAWMDASIPDLLRLFRGTDYGIRGNLALSINARTEAQDWLLQARAEIRQVHRWDLPLRADNPSLNLSAKVSLDPEHSGFQVIESSLETPHSNARATGMMSWNQPFGDRYTEARENSHVYSSRLSLRDSREELRDHGSQPALKIVSDGISLADALAWARAFHSGISDDLTLQGFATIDLALGGWPPQLDDGTLSIESAQLTGKTLPVPVYLNATSLHYDPKGISVLPATLSFGASGGAIHIETLAATPKTTSGLHIAGSLADAGNLISTARLLGWDISRGWDITGPVRGDLKWQASPDPWQGSPIGTLDFGAPVTTPDPVGEPAGRSNGDTLRAPFLNLPVEQIKAHVDLKPNVRHINLASARAFGAAWNGSFDRRELPADGWRFDLAADRLVAADIDRWLNPRWRQSFIDRVLPFLNSRPLATVSPDRLAASGKITVDQFTLAPFVIRRVQGDAIVDGRRVTLANFRAQFYKGDINGSVRADLDAIPSYRMNLDFSNVDLSSLTAAAPSLADRFDGSTSGKISLVTRGTTRADLLSSLECRGTAKISAAELLNIDLDASIAAAAFRPGRSSFREASTEFTCADSKLNFQHLQLSTSAPAAIISGEGAAEFNRNLDFNLTVPGKSAADHGTQTSQPRPEVYRLTGNLAEPQITRIKPASASP